MIYILLVNMYSSDNIWSLAELSTINYDPYESNPTCYEDSALEENMWHTISFKIVQKTEGLFLVWHLERFFLAFQLGLLEFVFSLLVIYSCLAKPFFGTLSHLRLTLSGLESLCKYKPPNIRMNYEAKKRWV